jgi:hypothetical protein
VRHTDQMGLDLAAVKQQNSFRSNSSAVSSIASGRGNSFRDSNMLGSKCSPASSLNGSYRTFDIDENNTQATGEFDRSFDK